MRLTFLLRNDGMAGGNKVVAIYSERLRRRGHHVTVVAGRLPKQSLPRRVRLFLLGHGWQMNPSAAPSYFDDLSVPLHVLEASRPILDSDVPDGDVVIATWWETAEWVNGLSSKKGAKVYFIQHHEIFSYLPVERCRATYRLPLRKIVISSWLKNAMKEIYQDDSSYLIPNSVEISQFFAPPREKSKVPTVGLLYSTATFKGMEILLSALGELKKLIPSVRGVAFGSEPLSAHFPLPDWVDFHYLPPQDSIRLLYEKCDVWVCGSWSEGFHLPPLEAMACRCPLVSTRVGGPLDVVKDGVNGFLVEVGDFSSLAERAATVLQMNEHDWKEMSDSALNTALAYSWDDATDLFERTLLELATIPT
jgi:glycosyltransferase involved in cell wall biosynthesis